MANNKDSMDSIRKAIGDLETRFDDVAKAVFGTDAFGKASGAATEIGVKAQKTVADQMTRNLEFFNMPSRQDVTAMGERLMTIDDRLIRIEAILEQLVPAERKPASGPKRTRKPPAKKPIKAQQE